MRTILVTDGVADIASDAIGDGPAVGNPDGTVGANGADGLNGADDAAGQDGSSGGNATPGQSGADGQDGVTVIRGPVTAADGTSGTVVADGADGRNGASGEDGTPGQNGADGQDGAAVVRDPGGSEEESVLAGLLPESTVTSDRSTGALAISVASTDFQATYEEALEDRGFAERLSNALERAEDTGRLDVGLSRAEVLLGLADSLEDHRSTAEIDYGILVV